MNIDDLGDVYATSAGQRYKLASLRVFRHFRDYVTNHDGWKEKYATESIAVWTKKSDPDGPGAGLSIVKVRCVFDKVAVDDLYDALHDPQFRKSWDDKMIEGKNLVRLDERNDIGYYSAKFPWPLADRDFLNQRFWMEFDNGDYIIMNRSVKHNDCPEKPDFVRAMSLITGYYLRPHPQGGTELLYITHSDIKGSIPHMLLNSATQKMIPSAMDRLRQNGENYPQWVKDNRTADFKPDWRTPKVSWDLPPAARVVPTPPEDATDAASLCAKLERQLAAAQGDNDAAAELLLDELRPSSGDDVVSVQRFAALIRRAADAIAAEAKASGAAPATVSEYAALIKKRFRALSDEVREKDADGGAPALSVTA